MTDTKKTRQEIVRLRALVAAGLLATEILELRSLGRDYATQYLQREPTPDMLQATVRRVRPWGSLPVPEFISGMAEAARAAACPIHGIVNHTAIKHLATSTRLPVKTIYFLAGIGLAWEAMMRNFIAQDGQQINIRL